MTKAKQKRNWVDDLTEAIGELVNDLERLFKPRRPAPVPVPVRSRPDPRRRPR
jgi:hypothetical protein